MIPVQGIAAIKSRTFLQLCVLSARKVKHGRSRNLGRFSISLVPLRSGPGQSEEIALRDVAAQAIRKHGVSGIVVSLPAHYVHDSGASANKGDISIAAPGPQDTLIVRLCSDNGPNVSGAIGRCPVFGLQRLDGPHPSLFTRAKSLT